MIKQPNSRFCFLCGMENEQGFKLSWYADDENTSVQTEVVIPDHFNGYPGIAHGGIVAALLDETSFRAILLQEEDAVMAEDLYLTANLKIRYRQPTPTGKPLLVVGWIENKGAGRIRVAAEVRKKDGNVTASCEALVVKAPDEYGNLFANEDQQETWEIYPD